MYINVDCISSILHFTSFHMGGNPSLPKIWMVKNLWKTQIKMHDLGVKPTIYGNTETIMADMHLS